MGFAILHGEPLRRLISDIVYSRLLDSDMRPKDNGDEEAFRLLIGKLLTRTTAAALLFFLNAWQYFTVPPHSMWIPFNLTMECFCSMDSIHFLMDSIHFLMDSIHFLMDSTYFHMDSTYFHMDSTHIMESIFLHGFHIFPHGFHMDSTYFHMDSTY